MTLLRALENDSRGAAVTSPIRALRDRASTVLPGLYAWVTTVALPSTQHGATGWARATAFGALVALIASPLFIHDRPHLGRALGVHAFIGLALLTWLLLGAGILQNRADPLLSALGALAFMLYALGWGSLRRRGAVPEDAPNVILGLPLQPRTRPPMLTPIAFGVIIAAALLPIFLAFRVGDAERGLFAHAAAILAAIVTISAGSRVALALGQRRSPPSVAGRLNAAAVPLALLALLFGLGFLWSVVR